MCCFVAGYGFSLICQQTNDTQFVRIVDQSVSKKQTKGKLYVFRRLSFENLKTEFNRRL